MIEFEQHVFNELKISFNKPIKDYSFAVDCMIRLPKYRPHSLDKAVSFCLVHLKDIGFKNELIKRASLDCPILIHRLFLIGALSCDDFAEWIVQCRHFISYYYFKNEKLDFPHDLIKSGSEEIKRYGKNFDDYEVELLIKYGFLPTSIGFCLKYDDIDNLEKLLYTKGDKREDSVIWSPFEWTKMPEKRDLLSFSAYFSSIRCFKLLLYNNYRINQDVIEAVVCSGSLDLFHLCVHDNLYPGLLISKASEFSHLELIQYLVEAYKIDIHTRVIF